MKITTLKASLMTAASLIFLVGPMAHATSADSHVVVDGRADLLMQQYNDDGNSRPSNSAFRINSFRMDVTGKIGTDNGYRFRMNFPNTPQTPTSACTTTAGVTSCTVAQANDAGYPGAPDNISSFFDYAYVTHSFSDQLSLVVGKQWAGTGGWVGTYDPADVYFYPQGFLDTLRNGVIYSTGAGLHFDTPTQKVWLTVTNPGIGSTDNATAAGNANNSRTLIGARYFGAFMDGTLQPTLNYSTESIQNQTGTTASKVYSFASAGLRYTVPMFDVDADYLMNSFNERTTPGQNDGTNSIYVLARYKMPDLGLKPFLAYENSVLKTERSATAETKQTVNSYQLGVEYYPNKGDDVRFHVVYTNSTTNTDLGGGVSSTNQNQQQIIAGMRFKMDLLK